MSDRRPLLLDVDTGVDDAIAIALATSLDTHELVAVTTVAGNVPIEKATDNTLRVLGWLNCSAPVFRGMSSPITRQLHSAEEFHGNDGLGGWNAPAAEAKIEPISAPEMIIQYASRHRGEIDFAFVGPLTNLAVALMLEPQIAQWIRHLVIMGGAFFGPGNVTDFAEFNIYVDPEAAMKVARSGINTTWIGLDVTTKTVLTREAWSDLSTHNHQSARLTYEVSKHAFQVRKRSEFHLHDPLAVSVIADPSLISTETGEVSIATNDEQRAMTRLSHNSTTDAVQQVATDVDTGRFSNVFNSLVGVTS